MRSRSAGVLILSLIMLSGCARAVDPVEPGSPLTTLQEARVFQNDELVRLAQYVSPEWIVGGFEEPIPRMHGLSCDWMAGAASSPDVAGVMLPGGYDLEVKPTVNLIPILEMVAEEYQQDGWAVDWEEPNKHEDLMLTSPEGYVFFVSATMLRDGGLEYSMSSFSPCLKAPEGFTLFDEY